MTADAHDARNGPFATATLAIAAATVLVALVGFLRQSAYYGRLGINVQDLGLSVENFMMASFPVLLYPVFLFLLYPAFEAGTRPLWRKIKTAGEDGNSEPEDEKLFRLFSWPAVAAAISLGAGAQAAASIGDETPRIPGLGITWADIVIWALIASLIAVIFHAQIREKESPWYHLMGNRRTGNIVLGLLAVVGLGIAGAGEGIDAGSAAAWGCVSLPFVTFDPPPASLNTSHDYWLIAHANGLNYLRDGNLTGDVVEYIIVPDEPGTTVFVARGEPLRQC